MSPRSSGHGDVDQRSREERVRYVGTEQREHFGAMTTAREQTREEPWWQVAAVFGVRAEQRNGLIVFPQPCGQLAAAHICHLTWAGGMIGRRRRAAAGQDELGRSFDVHKLEPAAAEALKHC